MRGTGAARRREEPPPDGAAIDADLRRIVAETDAGIGRLRRHERGITSVIARLEKMGPGCGDAGRYALLADKLAARLALTVTELMSLDAHNAETREAAELYAQTVCFNDIMRKAAVAEERDGAGRSRPPKARHRKTRLRVVGGTAAAASLAAASVVAGGAYASHDSASVHHWSAPRHAAVRLHASRPDPAVPGPRPSSSPRPSAAVASASPAVTAVPSSPAPASVPAPPPPVPAVPALSVQRLLDLGDSILGRLSLSAQGTGEVAWTATATDGIRLSSYAGEAVPGETVTLGVTDPSGGVGWVYVSFGGTVIPVEVTSGLGSPVLALSSGL